jgi:alkanesulfonate monooxygenase SsuD/methylene tetrahydromethanopterin reductase-like flavin-dependent oxidoreductase (luciferase family)
VFIMRFDMRAPGASPHEVAALYAAAIDMAAWSENEGCVAIVVSEHHGAEDGYLPAPLMLATAIAARTSKVRITIGAALLPLYQPARLAEELIVLDHISKGRVSATLALGYRASEYELFDVPYATRAAVADEKLGQFLELLREQPADGSSRRVTPAPFTPNGPTISWGGGTPAAARRAGRFGLDFSGQSNAPGLAEAYTEACLAAGHPLGNIRLPSPENPSSVFVAHDIDAAWAEIGSHLLHDARSYATWNSGLAATASGSQSLDVDALRAERGAYRILTPDEAVEQIRTSHVLALQPLCGGIPPEVAWRYVRTVVDDVMPRLGASAQPAA